MAAMKVYTHGARNPSGPDSDAKAAPAAGTLHPCRLHNESFNLTNFSIKLHPAAQGPTAVPPSSAVDAASRGPRAGATDGRESGAQVHQQSTMSAVVPVLPQKDPLPRPEGEPALQDGNR